VARRADRLGPELRRRGGARRGHTGAAKHLAGSCGCGGRRRGEAGYRSIAFNGGAFPRRPMCHRPACRPLLGALCRGCQDHSAAVACARARRGADRHRGRRGLSQHAEGRWRLVGAVCGSGIRRGGAVAPLACVAEGTRSRGHAEGMRPGVGVGKQVGTTE
jgi:hypothetical protein